MDPLTLLGSVVSGGASLLGSSMTSSANAKASRLNLMAQEAENQRTRDYNAIQSENANAMAMANAQMDRQAQQDFARMGVQWRVQDARAAGIHPLAAMGAQLASASPVSVGITPDRQTASTLPELKGSSPGAGIASMGQDIGRAIQAMQPDAARQVAVSEAKQKLDIQHAELSNELIATQIAKLKQPGTGPGLPRASSRYFVDGQGNTPEKNGLIKEKAMERTVAAPESNGVQEPGTIPETGYTRTATGWAPTMSKDVKDRLEEDMLGEIGWNIRNRIAPIISWYEEPPKGVQLKRDEKWYYNPFLQQYEIKKPWINPSRTSRAEAYSKRRNMPLR